MGRLNATRLDLDEIQGDVLAGMQKNAELFLFFKITDGARFKALGARIRDRPLDERPIGA